MQFGGFGADPLPRCILRHLGERHDGGKLLAKGVAHEMRHGDIVVFSLADEVMGGGIMKIAAQHAAGKSDEHK